MRIVGLHSQVFNASKIFYGKMSSSPTTEMTEQLVKDYANYAKVDWNNQMKNVHDIIEDTLIRLEEFQSIVAMVENSSTECMQQHLPKLQHMKDDMTTLRKRIDALEHVVAMANMNLSTLEAAVDKAEADLGVSDRLFGILNPLSFFKKAQEPVASSAVPIYKAPIIYRSDDYFQRE